MKKSILLLGILGITFFLTSCSSNSNKAHSMTDKSMDIENANEVMKYYDMSLNLLKNMVREKDVKDILGYMEQRGKNPTVPDFTSPVVNSNDSVLIMNPDTCFDIATRQELQRAYNGLFTDSRQFYANYNAFQSYIMSGKYKKDNYAEGAKLLANNYTLSIKMSEDKQVIYDMLNTAVEQAKNILSQK